MYKIEDIINKVHCADCLSFMKKIPDDSIDLVLTDPPYGDNIGYGRMGKKIENNEDETINYKMLDIVWNKMKDNTNLYLFTNWKFEIKLRNYIEKYTKFNIRMLLVVVKNNFGMGYSFRNQYELCLVLEKGKPKYNKNDFSNVLYMQYINHTKDTHPHEKSKNILSKMIEHSSIKGDIVLDCFAGSGSHLVAAQALGRNFIGVEISEKYCEIARQRLNQMPLPF